MFMRHTCFQSGEAILITDIEKHTIIQIIIKSLHLTCAMAPHLPYGGDHALAMGAAIFTSHDSVQNM